MRFTPGIKDQFLMENLVSQEVNESNDINDHGLRTHDG
jgi:hypothetical protein